MIQRLKKSPVAAPSSELATSNYGASATLHLVQSTRFARRLARLLMLGLLLCIAGMAFLPWQQTSRGAGAVAAFAPSERQQSVEATAKGVIVRLGTDEFGNELVEGSKVKKGDLIIEIEPFAANQIQELKAQLNDIQTQINTAKNNVDLYQDQIETFAFAQNAAVKAATNMLESAKRDLESQQEKLPGHIAKVKQAKLNYDRQLSLEREGLKPPKEIEKLEKEWVFEKSNLAAALRKVDSMKEKVSAKENELEEKRAMFQTYIDKNRTFKQEAIGKEAAAQKKMRDVKIKLKGISGRNEIFAPRDGTIYRIPFVLGQEVKEGDSLVTLIPDTSQNAVELMVNGNDMPLVQQGQEVRLQFEGWPAVQFPGWPSVAVGTFSGQVATVDATDDGKGQFRILVTPMEGEKWPEERFLRQGVRANGWVMLGEVTLGYEIWRQLNGFPVIVGDEAPKAKEPKSKPPKMQK